jgi:formamidopyrimidine-DNA glycosylase
VLRLSIELPEAQILATQMNKELKDKKVRAYELQNCQNLQKLGCINRNASAFDGLVGGKISAIISRGNVILVRLSNGWDLVLAPEYGGIIQFCQNQNLLPSKFHLKLNFQDDTALTVSLTGLGCIQAVAQEDLGKNYLYKRDFSEIPSPLDKAFTLENFLNKLSEKKQNVKAALVGKTAVLVGLSNSAFQDIIYRAKIHPKRNTASLRSQEKTALYKAINTVIHERLRAGGKNQFTDLYGKQGGYVPLMGPNMKDQNCPNCKAKIEKINHGGGQVYLCTTCQK